MGYTREQWEERSSHRTDLSAFLVHLTKGIYDENGGQLKTASQVLGEILTSKKLLGSTTQSGYIIGDNKAVCFQDMPLHSVCQNILFEQERTKDRSQMRYTAVGIAFPKAYVYAKGGRPVMYEKKEIAKNLLPRDEWWRIVNLNLDDKENFIDWTHEREWRVKGDFQFDLKSAVVLFGSPPGYRGFVENTNSTILKELGGINMMARGGGKNGLISSLCHFFISPLHGIERYNVSIVANNEKQAKVSFREVYDAIKGKEILEDMFYRTKVEILSNDTQSIMQYHTSNAGSKDGLRDGCVIYDEIHRYENFDVVNVFSSGLGKVPNAREFFIGTDRFVRDGFLDKTRERAMNILKGKDLEDHCFPSSARSIIQKKLIILMCGKKQILCSASREVLTLNNYLKRY
ncbi:terminase [Bacillus toyonensis]|nr:terminase [Bacillus toyonensis]